MVKRAKAFQKKTHKDLAAMVTKAVKSGIKQELASMAKKQNEVEAMAVAVKKEEDLVSDMSLNAFQFKGQIKDQDSQDSDESHSFMSMTGDLVWQIGQNKKQGITVPYDIPTKETKSTSTHLHPIQGNG